MAEDSRSSWAVEEGPTVARFLMPSIADCLFIAVLGTVLLTPLAVLLLGDAGTGWHIRTGQQILAAHAIPRVDPFSATMGGKAWFAWEWLYDVIVGRLDSEMGLNGVVWFNAVVIAAVFAGLFRFLIVRGTSLLFALVLTLLAISASTVHLLARPHVVSWLFVLIWWWVLDAAEPSTPGGKDRRRELWLAQLRNLFTDRGQSPHPVAKSATTVGQPLSRGKNGNLLWALPLLMLVWANVHGGFVTGFVLLGIFWIDAGWSWFRAREGRLEELVQKIAARRLAIELTWVGLASALASLINPYGWKLPAHIYAYLSNRFLMDHIEEFRSPDFHGAAQKCFLALLLVAIAVVLVRGRGLRVSQGLTILFAVASGLYATRNIPVAAILLVIVIGPLVREMRIASDFFRRMEAVEIGQCGHLWPAIAALFLFGVSAHGGRIGALQVMDAHFDPTRMPVQAVDYLLNNNVQGAVLAPDYWGGYLIYRGYPKLRPVVDDRHDLYGEAFFRSYLKMMHGEEGWQEFLWEHPAAVVVVPKDGALASLLERSTGGGWEKVHEDGKAGVFERRPLAEIGEMRRAAFR